MRQSYRSLRCRSREGRSTHRSKENSLLLYRIRQHAPLTVSGMLILARGMMLFEECRRATIAAANRGEVCFWAAS